MDPLDYNIQNNTAGHMPRCAVLARFLFVGWGNLRGTLFYVLFQKTLK
jgi:hypothetical protein